MPIEQTWGALAGVVQAEDRVEDNDVLAPEDFRRNPRFQGENFVTNLELVDQVRG